jgi:hypothetical protein
MWDRINKVIIQNAIAVVVIVGCFAMALIAELQTHEIPVSNMTLINKVIDVTLMGVVGWLFTQAIRNKNQNP